jgi:hypothetical protein
MMVEPLIALEAPKLEGPRGIFTTSLYGQSAPDCDSYFPTIYGLKLDIKIVFFSHFDYAVLGAMVKVLKTYV